MVHIDNAVALDFCLPWLAVAACSSNAILSEAPMWLRSALAFVFITVGASCLPSPGERKADVFKPSENSFTCISPPADVLLESMKAGVDVKVAKIGEILNANASVSQKVQRVREQSKGIQDFEVVDYRLCVAVAEGRLSKERYEEFVVHVFKQIVIEAPVPDEYSRGKRDGQAIRGVMNMLTQFYVAKGHYPSSLEDVQVAEYLAVLGTERIRYARLDEQRGYELRFAGQDGVLDTPDDKHHFGSEVPVN